MSKVDDRPDAGCCGCIMIIFWIVFIFCIVGIFI